jgi:hypothetical protein
MVSPEHAGADKSEETGSGGAAESNEAAPLESDATPPIAFAEVTDRLRRAGRWRPLWDERGIEEFYRALASIGEIRAGAGEPIDAARWFAEFLEELPPVVAMGESAPADPAAGEDGAPRGGNVDPESARLHRAVLAYRRAHPEVEYAEALSRCGAERLR